MLAEKKEKSGGAGKAAAKERLTRFFDLLEEIKELHQLARVLEDDAEQGEMLEDEVVKLVVPSLQRFTQKMREKEFSKSESERRSISEAIGAECSMCGSCRSF